MKKILMIYMLLLTAVSLSAQAAPTFYERISASTVYLRHEIFMDPALCKNPAALRKWEENNDIKVLSTYLPLASGSGFLISDGSLILTNRHVVTIESIEAIRKKIAEMAGSAIDQNLMKFTSLEEKRSVRSDLLNMINRGVYRFSASIGDKIYVDPEQVAVALEGEADIAALRLRESVGLGLPLANADSITTAIVGREVFSFGFPLGISLQDMFEDVVVTMNKGNISALRKADLGIQHSAAISAGNSGGPLVDATGTVIGMNTAGIEEGNSLFFAVGSDRIRDFLSKRGIALAEPPSQSGTPIGIRKNAAGEIEVSGTVLVESEKGARVILDGKDLGFVPQLVTLITPTASLHVRTENGAFSAKLRLVPVLRGTTVIKADLVKTGNLVITANVDDVRVIIDGDDVGELTTGVFRGLTIGNHKVELVGMDLYGSGTILIAEETTAQVHIEVSPASRLRVNVPADVIVSLTGPGFTARKTGGAWELTLPLGEYEVRAEGGEYFPAASSVRIRKGETATWEPYKSGLLSFAVTPSGANLHIPGREPLSVDMDAQGINPGTYEAVLRKPGFRDQKVTLVVTAGKRTEVSGSLEELARGVIFLPRLGCPVAIRFGDQEIQGIETPDRLLRFDGIPAGYPLEISFHSKAAASGDLDIPMRRIFLQEGEAITMELPSGAFTLPWVPTGAVVEIGKDPAVELVSEGGLEYRSPPLPPGRFPVSIQGGALGDGVMVEVVIASDGTSDHKTLREALISSLSEAIARDKSALTKRKGKSRIGYTSLGIGTLGAVGAVTFFILGDQAMEAYRAATTTEDAVEQRKIVETWQTLLYTSSGIGLIGLGLSPVFLLGKPSATELEKSIRTFDEGVRALGN
jgi:hypothetical protein